MTPDQAEALAQRSADRMARRLGGSGFVPDAVARIAAAEEDPAADEQPMVGDQPQEDAETLRAQLREVREELSAHQGRNGPLQRDVETYRQLTADLQRNLESKERELAELAAAKPTPAFDPSDVLSAEEIEEIDPMVLAAISKLAGAMVQRSGSSTSVEAQVRQVLEKRQQEELREYREQALLSRDLSDIVQLKSDARFTAWVEQDENEIESVVTMLLNATNKAAIDKYARLLKRKIDSFKESVKAPQNERPASDATTALAAGMRRGVSKPSNADMAGKLAEAKRLARSRSAADRQKANDILNALGG